MIPEISVGKQRSLLVRLSPALLGVLLGMLALGPALAPGFTLRYDMVFVPDPPIFRDLGGFPRSVPSDLVVAVLSYPIPAMLVQKLILLGIFLLAATGAAALVPRDRTAARLVAAAFYAWNLYLAQRLLLGQWALLLGYAGLPWAVRAAAQSGVRRFAIALIPAAVGGFQAMLVTLLAVLPVTARHPERWRAIATASTVAAVFSLPWLIPALRSGAATDPAGVDAFAARADGPFGTVGSLLSLGGIWNAEAGVPGQGSWASATIRLLVSAIAIWGFARLLRRSRDPALSGLAVAAALGLGIACLGAFLPDALKTLISWWPAFGPLRDGQVYLAPLALVLALGLASFARGRFGLAAVVVPVLVLPTLAIGAFGRLTAADYPAEWRQVQRIVNADPAPGALVSLPWRAHRVFRWTGGQVILDPATKLFARRVVWNDTLMIESRESGTIAVTAEDPLARRVGALLAEPGPAAPRLAAAGIRYILVSHANENEFLLKLQDVTPIFRGESLLLLRL
ncbi:hypothetical protein Acor_29140 [Acrocarpospora corrugata]|uniref:Uncharacterized protein n=1 Tax=Acrocarpospora corrugata TaxID=35763 RepID=A0A5M3VY53_9ACTN|nr:hypothetical protein [Acrocarpospora corrugata]GES00850.1 hypothetical protein Acor_29140 [Acrocarpospora corrugata]